MVLVSNCLVILVKYINQSNEVNDKTVTAVVHKHTVKVTFGKIFISKKETLFGLQLIFSRRLHSRTTVNVNDVNAKHNVTD